MYFLLYIQVYIQGAWWSSFVFQPNRLIFQNMWHKVICEKSAAHVWDSAWPHGRIVFTSWIGQIDADILPNMRRAVGDKITPRVLPFYSILYGLIC